MGSILDFYITESGAEHRSFRTLFMAGCQRLDVGRANQRFSACSLPMDRRWLTQCCLTKSFMIVWRVQNTYMLDKNKRFSFSLLHS